MRLVEDLCGGRLVVGGVGGGGLQLKPRVVREGVCNVKRMQRVN